MAEKKQIKIKRCAVFALAHVVAAMPWWLLYGMSNFAQLVMRVLVPYRRKVIDNNLAASYPQLSAAERKRLRHRFYANFADYIVESFKLLSMSDAELKRRMVFENEAIADAFLESGRSVVVYFSHCFNWEWAPSVSLWSRPLIDGTAVGSQVYRPLKDAEVDELMLKLRSRTGTRNLPKRLAFLDLMRYKKRGIPTMTGFMSDQKPSHGDPGRVVRFFNRDTAFITGTETVARRLEAAVVYWDIHKTSRGHYRIEVKLIAEDANALPEGAITDRYAALLQETINRDPALWLWSHNRWKVPVASKDLAELTAQGLRP